MVENPIKRDTVEYNDSTPFDNSKLQSIDAIIKAIRHKMYGKHVREPIAQLGEALIKLLQETGGNQSAEVIAARGNFELLGIREDAQDATIADLTGKVNNKADKNYISDYLSKVSYVPETYLNLAALKAKYPSGRPGLFVTADNGHKYIWNGKEWQDAGIYQAIGIADGSVTSAQIADNAVTNKKLKSMSLGKVTDGYSDLTALDANHLFGVLGSAVSGYADTFIFNKKVGDSGFKVPVSYPDGASLTKPLRVYFEIKKESLDKAAPIGVVNEVYLSDSQKKLLSKRVNATVTKPDADNWDVINFEIPATAFVDNNISGDTMFYLTPIWHGGAGTIYGRYWCVNETGPNSVHYIQPESVTTEKLSNDISIRKFNSNFAENNPALTDAYDFSQNDGVKFTKTVAGDNNVRFKVNVPKSDLYKDLYGSFDVLGDAQDNSAWEVMLSDVNNKTILGDVRPVFYPDDTNYKRLQFKITWSKLANSPSQNEFYLALLTHGKVGQWGIIKNLVISSLPFGGDISDAIAHAEYIDSDCELIGDATIVDDNAEKSSIDGLTAFTNAAPVTQDGMVLGKVQIYSDVEKPAYTAVVAQLDQYNLLVNETNVSDLIGALHVGINTFDLSKYNITMHKGSYLFIKSSQLSLYNVPGTRVKALVCDSTHEVTSPYVGFGFYQSGLLAPLYYEVVEKSALQKMQDKTSELEQANEDLKNKISQPIKLVAPNGSPYKLTINNDGGLSAISLVPHNVVMLGNSLMKEKGGFGMAASDQYHDYYYLVSQKLKAMNSAITIAERHNVYAWEAGICSSKTATTMSQKRQAWWAEAGDALVPDATDLVTIQLVDNINSDEREATLESDAVTLIQNIKAKAPHARILWVAGWFGAQSKIDKIRNACKTAGVEFVDITTRRYEPGMQSSIGSIITGMDGSTWTVDSAGVASHPSDLGMQYIADQIMAVITA